MVCPHVPRQIVGEYRVFGILCTGLTPGIPWYIPLHPTPHTQSTWYHVGLCDPMVHPIGSDSTHSVPHIHPVQSVPCGTLGCHGTSHCIPLHTLSPTYTSRTKCTMWDSGMPWYIPLHPTPHTQSHIYIPYQMYHMVHLVRDVHCTCGTECVEWDAIGCTMASQSPTWYTWYGMYMWD